MRSWLTIAATFVFMSSAGMALAFNPITDLAGDAGSADYTPIASAPCGDPDGPVACNEFTANGFQADGEWNPVLDPFGTGPGVVGYCATTERIVRYPMGPADPACGGAADFIPLSVTGQAQRGFAWGTDPAAGDFYTSSWTIAPSATARIRHYDPSGTLIAEYGFADPLTGGDLQGSGLAMDYARGHMWMILRNNHPTDPANPPVSRLVEFEFDANGAPVVRQGPIDMPWNGGPSIVSSAGLEYNNLDCTIVALRQDSQNIGVTELTTVQDNDPAGTGGVSFLGFCQIPNAPCTGGGPAVNRPWGIALIETAPVRVMFTDLNNDGPPACGTIINPIDAHLTDLPPVTGSCGITAVQPTTWGAIKNSYSR